MTGTPGVSVVMTFFDAEAFLHDAIRSVVAQTYERWELLLVDDGSTVAALGSRRSGWPGTRDA